MGGPLVRSDATATGWLGAQVEFWRVHTSSNTYESYLPPARLIHCPPRGSGSFASCVPRVACWLEIEINPTISSSIEQTVSHNQRLCPPTPTPRATMKVFSVLVSSALLSFGCCQAADSDYVYGRDPKKDAEYDIATGMAGIQQAAKDPKLLAQLMQDMQVRRPSQERRRISSADLLHREHIVPFRRIVSHQLHVSFDSTQRYPSHDHRTPN